MNIWGFANSSIDPTILLSLLNDNHHMTAIPHTFSEIPKANQSFHISWVFIFNLGEVLNDFVFANVKCQCEKLRGKTIQINYAVQLINAYRLVLCLVCKLIYAKL